MKIRTFRAYSKCTAVKDQDEELDFFKDTFIANGYPLEIVDRVFQIVVRVFDSDVPRNIVQMEKNKNQ